jgi:hypothetical protein
LRVEPARDHAQGDVAVADDSNQSCSLLDHRQHADILDFHQPRRLLHRRLRFDRAWPFCHQLCDLRAHARLLQSASRGGARPLPRPSVRGYYVVS